MENTVNSAWYMKGKHLEYEMGSGFLDLSFNEISPEWFLVWSKYLNSIKKLYLESISKNEWI